MMPARARAGIATRALAALAAVATLAATGCSRAPSAAAATASAATPEEDARFVSVTLARSTVFQAELKRCHTSAYVIEECDERTIVVAIGESTQERFSRHETLRVHRDGSVERLVVDAAGEESWVPETAAP